MDKIKIIITNTGNWNYMMWFFLGFYQNENIDLKFESGYIQKLPNILEMIFCQILLGN